MVRVLAVADSDSYLKWTSATCAAMPPDWQIERVVITTPITPSSAQIAAAAGTAVPVITLAQLLWWVAQHPPDVLLLGCTGPVVQAILVLPQLRYGSRRPVLMTGLPGISVPATSRAIRFRAACDLFVVHSRRERAEFAHLGRWYAPGMRFALARLPFLPSGVPAAPPVTSRPDVVFAAQAKVPCTPDDRRLVLQALADTRAGRAVVKLRAAQGEEQTHRELWAYPELWLELVANGSVAANAVRFSTGSMADALASAGAFVTVSSTAALEAMAAGVPVLILADFGVSAEMINLVFEGSGCLGTCADLRNGRFFLPSAQWLSDNYFHPLEDSDWLERLQDLLRRRATGGLPRRALIPVGSSLALVRRQLRLVLPAPAWSVLSRTRRGLRRVRRGLRSPGRTVLGRLRDRPGGSASAEPPPAPRGEHRPPLSATPPPASRPRH